MMYNPERLRLARERRGLTMAGLAKTSELTSKTISNYENAVPGLEPTDASMEKIAKALGYPLSFFLREEIPTLEQEAVSFRAMSKLSVKNKNSAIAAGKLAKEFTQWLDEHFTLPELQVPALETTDYIDPADASASLRQTWRLGELSINNMVHLLESKGVRVYSLAENCLEVDAFSFWEDDTPYILLNTIKSPERSRFDAAHELGHLVMHKYAQNHGPEAEKQANQFASAFLMPEASVKSILRPWPTLHQLIQQKKHWKVSLAALVRRSYDLEFSSDWHYRQLSIQLSRLGYRTHEPEGIEKRESSLLISKVFHTLHSKNISQKVVLNQLGWPVDELKNLTFGRGLGMHVVSNEKSTPSEVKRPDLRVVK